MSIKMTVGKLKQNAKTRLGLSLSVEPMDSKWVPLDDVLALEKELRAELDRIKYTWSDCNDSKIEFIQELLGGIEHAKKETDKK